jgi:hypothetical protein
VHAGGSGGNPGAAGPGDPARAVCGQGRALPSRSLLALPPPLHQVTQALHGQRVEVRRALQAVLRPCLCAGHLWPPCRRGCGGASPPRWGLAAAPRGAWRVPIGRICPPTSPSRIEPWPGPRPPLDPRPALLTPSGTGRSRVCVGQVGGRTGSTPHPGRGSPRGGAGGGALPERTSVGGEAAAGASAGSQGRRTRRGPPPRGGAGGGAAGPAGVPRPAVRAAAAAIGQAPPGHCPARAYSR